MAMNARCSMFSPAWLGLLSILATVSAPAVQAQGFTVHDLTALGPAMEQALGSGFSHLAQARRVTLSCLDCAGSPMVDVLLGQQTDGTEQRLRSGETKIATLEALCRERDATCRLSALDVAPAAGWISTWQMGGQRGATAVMLYDGDLLTIRSLAQSDGLALANAEKLAAFAADRIVGR